AGFRQSFGTDCASWFRRKPSPSFNELRASAETHAVDGRQRGAHGHPTLAAIFAYVQVARGATESQAIAADVQRMPIHHVVSELLRQTPTQLFPGFAAVFGARHEQPAVDRHALGVGNARDHVGAATVLFVDRDREPEVYALLRLAHLLPGGRAVGAVEDA